MNSVFDNYRYQLVYPIQSTSIQIAKNISNGSKKCYNELKSRQIVAPLFVVHSLDTNELYHYEIPKYKKNIDQDNMIVGGGDVGRDDVGRDDVGRDDDGTTKPNNDPPKEKTIDDIIRRLEILEKKLNILA